MPNVTAPTRQMGNGDVVTQFVDSVGTSAVTYTYPKTQEKFRVRNMGQQSLSVTVAGTTQTVVAGDKWEKVADFTSFAINAVSGITAFDAWADEKGSTFDSPEGKYFGSGVSSSSSSASSSYGNTAVVLGDSLTIGSPLPDNSWAYYAAILAKGRFNLLYNAGMSGQNTTSILARVQSDVIAKNPKICVILAGTNDVLQGLAPSLTRSNIESMITQCQSANIMPILCTIPPADTTGHQSQNDTINFIIRSLGAKYRLLVCDFHTPMLNTATGLFSNTYSSDLVHPYPAGAKVLGQKFVTDIVPMLPMYTLHMPTANATTSNLVTNGLFSADNWTKTGTGSAASSLFADASISGNWLEINKTVADSLSNVWTSNAATVVPGRRYVISGRIQTVGAEAGALTYAVYAGKNIGGNEFILTDLTRDVDGTFYLETTMGAGQTLLNINLRVSAGTGKVRIAQVSIYDATTLGL